MRDIISRTKEIAENAKREDSWFPEVEKGKADTLGSYTGKITNHRQSECHYPQSHTTQTAVPGHHLAEGRKTGEVQFESKPTKPGKRNMLDGKKTFKVDHPAAEAATYVPQSSTTQVNRREETITKKRYEKSSAGSKTQHVSVSDVDENAKTVTTALTASVKAIEAIAPDFTVRVTTALDIEVTNRGEVGCMILDLARRSTIHIMCTIRSLISAGWVMALARW